MNVSECVHVVVLNVSKVHARVFMCVCMALGFSQRVKSVCSRKESKVCVQMCVGVRDKGKKGQGGLWARGKGHSVVTHSVPRNGRLVDEGLSSPWNCCRRLTVRLGHWWVPVHDVTWSASSVAGWLAELVIREDSRSSPLSNWSLIVLCCLTVDAWGW